jgi:hypothetical protein
MKINIGKATYSHFSMVAHTDEAMLFPAGRELKNTMPTKPTMKRENPTQIPELRVRTRTPNTKRHMIAKLASIISLPLPS